jgi:hypothetical protein
VTDALPRLVLRRDALDEGFSDGEIGRLTRRLEWIRLRRGAHLDGAAPDGAAARHRLLVSAALGGIRRPAVVSHQSAAVLLGLPLWWVRLDQLHLTRRPPSWNDAGRTLVVHVGHLDDDEVVDVRGVLVTSPARTAVDLAGSLSSERAVVVLDAALHGGHCNAATLAEALGRCRGRPGVRSASRAVSFADGRSESVGESRSRVVLHRLGLSPSDLQFPVHGTDGAFLGRTDSAWQPRPRHR